MEEWVEVVLIGLIGGLVFVSACSNGLN